MLSPRPCALSLYFFPLVTVMHNVASIIDMHMIHKFISPTQNFHPSSRLMYPTTYLIDIAFFNIQELF